MYLQGNLNDSQPFQPLWPGTLHNTQLESLSSLLYSQVDGG